MPSRATLATAFLASTAVAIPAFPGMITKTIYGRDSGPDACGDTTEDGQVYIADLGFYSDKDCNDKTGHVCVYTYKNTADAGSGNYGCNPGLLPDTTPFYARIEDSGYDSMQLVFTRDQSCPPDGPGAVFATMVDNKNCVQFNQGGDGPGVTVFPNGGSGLSLVGPNPGKHHGGHHHKWNTTGTAGGGKKKVELAAGAGGSAKKSVKSGKTTLNMAKRGDPKCDGFNIESSSPSYSPSVQVSSIVDCTNGGTPGCSITAGQQHTESVSTSYSVTAGGGIEGIFEASATFGMEYTESTTTSIQEGLTVQPGQKGYLSAYSAATLFKGKFTGCDGDSDEIEGQALVIKNNGFTYSIVNTGI
ncbi:hypothetical protein F5Y17DRAFT_222187 [Xylariaceae sp. FL0594]|nr:hypothetical protein F5Y17DRAFT_222187 [Xylariaceae sp. FL0594]